jgi:hypothetical protein
MLWAALSHQELPEKVPQAWTSRRAEQSPVELSSLMRDDPEDYPPIDRTGEISNRNRRTVEDLLEKILPLIEGPRASTGRRGPDGC